jgi:hypothetical protein
VSGFGTRQAFVFGATAVVCGYVLLAKDLDDGATGWAFAAVSAVGVTPAAGCASGWRSGGTRVIRHRSSS